MTRDEAIEVLTQIQYDEKDRVHKGWELWSAKSPRIEALDMAIEALKQTHWIPCSERLPEVGEDVLISVGSGVYEAHLRESKEYFLTHKTKALVAEWEVDAWMPLPKPYEGGTE